MNPNEFYSKYRPAAAIVQSLTGIDQNTVLSWMSWESDFATNEGSKHNNLSGINYTSAADYKIPGTSYAGYYSLENYAKDYARVLNIDGYGYPEVLHLAKTTNNDVVSVTTALNASQYAVDDYNVDTILSRARAAAGVTGGSSTPQKNDEPPSSGGSGASRFDGLDRLIKMAIWSEVIDGIPMFEPTPLKQELYDRLKNVLTLPPL